ncbi:MAG: GLUG motif-containing protein [Thermoplasmatota archaeon]
MLSYLVSSIASINASNVISTNSTISLFSKGSGCLNDPYMIENVVQLQNMKNDLGAHYSQANDIDAGQTNSWNNGLGFAPIGTSMSNAFTGSLNGNNYSISDLYINRPQDDFVGLFGFVGDSGVISNVSLIDAEVSSGTYQCIGTLVGRNRGLVTYCSATGHANGGYRVGGLVGENNPGTVQYSHASVTVNAVDGRIGGLVGFNVNGLVYRCSATGNVTGGWYVGGLVGRNLDSTVIDSYATGMVSGSTAVGGLAGDNEGSTIIGSYSDAVAAGSWAVGGLLGYVWSTSIVNCYASGEVNANSDVGGLAGYIVQSSIDKSYANGYVNGNSNAGGLVGVKTWGSSVTNSFWDVGTSGMQTSDGGIGKPTAEMKKISTYETASWDISLMQDFIDEIWFIDDGVDYPRLGWEFTSYVPLPTLSCTGSFSWTNITPGDLIKGTFTVQNNGDPVSLLDWEIQSYPDWGTWTFDPDGGLGLKPEDGMVTVNVEVVAPNEPETEFTGEILVVNGDDPDNFCSIDVALVTPMRYQSILISFTQKLVQWFWFLGSIFKLF